MLKVLTFGLYDPKKLLDAVGEGDLERAKAALAKGYDPNKSLSYATGKGLYGTNYVDVSPLFLAGVYKPNKEIVRAIYEDATVTPDLQHKIRYRWHWKSPWREETFLSWLIEGRRHKKRKSHLQTEAAEMQKVMEVILELDKNLSEADREKLATAAEEDDVFQEDF